MTTTTVTPPTHTGNPATIETVLTELAAVHDQACELLMKVDPLAVELHQQGFRLGVQEGERQAVQRAESAVTAFLDYLGEEPGPVPGLNDPRRVPAYARVEAAA